MHVLTQSGQSDGVIKLSILVYLGAYVCKLQLLLCWCVYLATRYLHVALILLDEKNDS